MNKKRSVFWNIYFQSSPFMVEFLHVFASEKIALLPPPSLVCTTRMLRIFSWIRSDIIYGSIKTTCTQKPGKFF